MHLELCFFLASLMNEDRKVKRWGRNKRGRQVGEKIRFERERRIDSTGDSSVVRGRRWRGWVCELELFPLLNSAAPSNGKIETCQNFMFSSLQIANDWATRSRTDQSIILSARDPRSHHGCRPIYRSDLAIWICMHAGFIFFDKLILSSFPTYKPPKAIHVRGQAQPP